MKLLAIETATDACSAALAVDGEVRSIDELAPRQHAVRLLAMVDFLLAEAGLGLDALEGIAFGRGPGSFTGVRIAASVAQGLAFGAGLRVAPVSTLAALAQGVFRLRGARAVLCALDARISEVYWGAYREERGLMCAAGEERVCAPGEVPPPEPGGVWVGAGEGWAAYGDELRARLGCVRVEEVWSDCYPSARDVAALGAASFERGEAVDPEEALPVYLRDRVTRA